jgi:hypothetical protein
VKALATFEVPESLRKRAEYTLNQAEKALGITLSLRWWTEGVGGAAGWVEWDDTNRINLSLEWAQRASSKDLMYVVFHESRHVYQHIKTGWMNLEQGEEDADRFVYQELGILPESVRMYWEK